MDWLSAITLDNIWEPGMRPCPKPVELHTNDFLNYVSYAATLKTVTLPQWKKFTFTDRLIAVTSAIFGLIQLETTASTTTTTRRGPRRAMDPMFKTLADGFVTLSKVVQGESISRRYMQESADAFMLCQNRTVGTRPTRMVRNNSSWCPTTVGRWS